MPLSLVLKHHERKRLTLSLWGDREFAREVAHLLKAPPVFSNIYTIEPGLFFKSELFYGGFFSHDACSVMLKLTPSISLMLGTSLIQASGTSWCLTTAFFPDFLNQL